MFLRKKGTSWSGFLLRDEMSHAGICLHCTRLDQAEPEMASDRRAAAGLAAMHGRPPEDAARVSH